MAALSNKKVAYDQCSRQVIRKLTWLVSGGDPAARSRRVEQSTAL